MAKQTWWALRKIGTKGEWWIWANYRVPALYVSKGKAERARSYQLPSDVCSDYEPVRVQLEVVE